MKGDWSRSDAKGRGAEDNGKGRSFDRDTGRGFDRDDGKGARGLNRGFDRDGEKGRGFEQDDGKGGKAFDRARDNDRRGKGKREDGKGGFNEDRGGKRGKGEDDEGGNDGKGKGRKGEKGEKGDKGGKGKGRPEKLISKGIRGKIVQFIKGKPSGFIRRVDGEPDVYFDFADVLDGKECELEDLVEFDIIEGTNQRYYATRVKILPKDANLNEGSTLMKSSLGDNSPVPLAPLSALGLTGGLLSFGAPKPKSLFGGGLQMRGPSTPSGSSAGALAAMKKKEEEPKGVEGDDGDGASKDICLWGRIVSVSGGFGFLQQINATFEAKDIFFRAADVVGMNSSEPGEEGEGLQIVLHHGRNSNGFKSFWLAPGDEVSYQMSKDHKGNPCAADIYKERKGQWRVGRRGGAPRSGVKKESLKDQLQRLSEMDVDEVLLNAAMFKEILESPDFDPSHLRKIIAVLANEDLAEDTRSDRLYRMFLDSKTMQASLRTTIISYSGGRHCGTFLEECLHLIVTLVIRTNNPKELRDRLPLSELVEAIEQNVRHGSSSTRKGLSEEMKSMLSCLEAHFPEVVNLKQVLGAKAPKQHRSAAEDYSELLEADYYQDMPILPTSAEMLGQCAFEIQENMRTYEKCEDYIQTHFMLLREDYIEPLRAGIKLFMQGRHSPKDLHVYTGVKVVGILSTIEGLVYRIELQKPEIKRINWEKSKQLMYGSLLCLSDDSFETLIWATVFRRDEHLIATEAQLDIRLPFESFDDRLAPGKVFCCIENVTIYFEAYRHVLIALQSMRPTDVPFQGTLLPPQPEPKPPGFLKADSDMFHFHNVFASCEKEDASVSAPKSFKILQQWPEALQQSLDIDPSQLDAIQHALTHQMALIQGPPGTGKTWVGLKIVQALLENTSTLRHSPILVVCFTNHALDQFLEGIFRFCERIARIGSRSKSEQMKARNLKELVMEMPPSKEYFMARSGLTNRRDVLRDNLAKLLTSVDSHLVSAQDAKDLMTEQQFENFYKGYVDYMGEDTAHLPDDAFEVDDELWHKIMKAWLQTGGDLTKFAPVVKKDPGGLPSADKFVDLNDDDDEEEEADQEGYERKLDVEEADDRQMAEGFGGSAPTEERKKPPMDFLQKLNSAWLPTLEEHVEKLKPEIRSVIWRDEEDLWRLPVSLRKEIYKQWLLEAHHEARMSLPELGRSLERNAEHRAVLERDRKLAVLREMEVVGMTTTAVSKYQQLLKDLRPEIVIVEEAAEVLEAHILTALHAQTQHVILIGDHQQLRPSTAVYRLSKNFHLDVSLFERLIHNGADHVTLLQQRRMHPKISRLIKPLYPALRDHSITHTYPEIEGTSSRCFFMKHNHFEDDEGESHSHLNTFEANFVAALCAHLVKSGYDESQITVLSPYLGQVRLLKQKLRRDVSTTNVHITAVDNFQGEENDIIVISLVRSNRNKSMGFLAVENRINVALTRARHGMFIVGNADMLWGHPLWTRILEELKSDGCLADTIPLVEKESGNTYQVKTSDEIGALLLGGNELFQTGGEGMNFSDLKGRGPVADRWAELGKEDLSSKGKGRGQRDSKGKKGSEQKGGRIGGKGHCGADGDESSPFLQRGSSSGSRAGYEKAEEAEPKPSGRPEKPPPAPPPARMEADGIHGECELVPRKGDQEEAEDADGKRGKKKKSGGKVLLMKCG